MDINYFNTARRALHFPIFYLSDLPSKNFCLVLNMFFGRCCYYELLGLQLRNVQYSRSKVCISELSNALWDQNQTSFSLAASWSFFPGGGPGIEPEVFYMCSKTGLWSPKGWVVFRNEYLCLKYLHGDEMLPVPRHVHQSL